ncbi:MAG: replication-relaxation family protein [Acidibacillus sp.]|nr:replication-relaxation family protein [Acidibacillus sp.]
MAHRDDIIDFLSTVRIANTEQVGRLFYADRGSPSKRASEALSELAKEKLVEGEIVKLGTPKLWRLTKKAKDSMGIGQKGIPFNTAKTAHWLAIADLYIRLRKIERPLFFIPEYREVIENKRIFSPDAWLVWRKRPFFVEVQLTVMPSMRWKDKWKSYELFYLRLDKRAFQPKPPARPVKPQILVVSRQRDSTIGSPRGIEIIRLESLLPVNTNDSARDNSK